MPYAIQQWDEQVLTWIAHHMRLEGLNPLVIIYTSLGNAGVCFILAGLVLIIWKSTRKTGVTALAALLIGFLVTNVTIKPLIDRARPWVAMEGFVPLVYSSDPHSFPSGHTNAAFAFGVAVLLTAPKRWMKVTGIVVAVLMGYSRLYVGVHFPTDVLAGAILGSLCGVIASILTKWWFHRQHLGSDR